MGLALGVAVLAHCPCLENETSATVATVAMYDDRSTCGKKCINGVNCVSDNTLMSEL